MEPDHRLTLSEETSTAGRKDAEPAYDLEERLLQYAAAVIRLVDAMPNTRSANHVAGQLLRSGTSALPNHGEAQGAESLADFIHKFKLCLKELVESRRWLRLIRLVPLVERPLSLDALIDETEQLIRIFAKSIETANSRSGRTGRVREDDEKCDLWVRAVWSGAAQQFDCSSLSWSPEQ